MNALDLLIVLLVALAALGGYRLGFVARGLSWAGLVIALLVAIRFVPDLGAALADATPRARLLGVLGFVFGIALLGQALGLAIGTLLHARLPRDEATQRRDRIAGALVGGLGVLVLLWLFVPALVSAPGWPARAARHSAIVGAIERVAPPPPAAVRELGRMVAEAPFPEVFSDITGPSDPGAPPVETLPASVNAAVAASVVKVEGQACDQIQDGTGFVIAPGRVVTNAHVVAGERHTVVVTPSGEQETSRVVAFDPRRDIAILDVPALDLPALRLGDGQVGTVGAVYGHPRGGPLRAAPARVAEQILARGTDIYRTTTTERDVFVLAARLEPGDSGGPLVNRRGRVIGVAFAIDPGADATGYALTNQELRAVLSQNLDDTIETGSCLIG